MGRIAKSVLVILGLSCLYLFTKAPIISETAEAAQAYIPSAPEQDFYGDAKFQVNSRHYREFWRWPGANLSKDLSIHRLYFLQASWSRNGQWVDYQHYPVKLTKINHCFLVYRLEKLADADVLMPRILADIRRWKKLGNAIAGIQFDFDSSTTALLHYAEFLHSAKAMLPPPLILSVTGLMDWGNADTVDLQALNQSVDEIIFQTYQDKSTLANLDLYFRKIISGKIPFKLGLVMNGEIKPKEFSEVIASEYFKGFVVFNSPALADTP